MSRKISFFDGASSSTTPTIGNIVASNLVKYANDAAYEAGEAGAPVTGNIYYNTTDNVIRYYSDGAWSSILDNDSSQVVENKTIDGTAATGNNIVITDADDVSYDNSSSGLAASDTQAAIDEVDGNVDDLETLAGAPNDTNYGTFTGTTIGDNQDGKTCMQDLETAVESKIDSSEKGAVNGVATLDGSGKLPSSQLPISVAQFLGNWDANTNSPTLIDGTGTQGDTYRVSVAGSQDLGSGSLSYDVGDWVYYDGTIWQKGDNIDQVTSVASKTGAVTLDKTDVGLSNVDNTSDATKNSATADLSNKTFTDPITMQEQGSTPATPAAGDQKIYMKTDGKFYKLDDTGSETEVGSGGTTKVITSIDNGDSPYSVLAADDIILVDTTSGATTVNLPAAASNEGRVIGIYHTGSGNFLVTVDGNGSETINGETVIYLTVKYDMTYIVSDGSNWLKLNESPPVIVYCGNTSGQLVNHNTVTVMTGWTEHDDNYNAFDNSVGIFTAPKKGVYTFTLTWLWQPTVSSRSLGFLTHYQSDSTTIINETGGFGFPTGTENQGICCVSYEMEFGEKVKPRIYHSEGSNRNLYAASDTYTTFSVRGI